MKLKAFIVSILLLQVKASILNELRGAMSSVENAFGKLLNDVVTDVKSTVHCTILAMEQVLAIRGIVTEPATFNNECDDYIDSIDSNTYKSAYEFKPRTEGDNRDFNSENDIAKQISSSITRVNESLINMLGNIGHEQTELVKGLLENETNRLTEVGLLLRQELEKISHNMKKQFQSTEFNYDKSSLESIWNDMKTLHDVERNQNPSEAKEIGRVLSEALNVLHINNTNDVTSDEDKIKVIMQELEHESRNSSVTFANINRELLQWKDEQSKQQFLSGHKLTPEEIPKTFKEVAKTIFKDKQNTRDQVVDHTSETAKVVTNEKDNGNKYGTKSSADDSANSKDSTINGVEHGKTICEANDIMKNSGQAQIMMNNILEKTGGAESAFKQNTLNRVVDHTSDPANFATNEKQNANENRTKSNEEDPAKSEDDSKFSDGNSEEDRKTIEEANDIMKDSAEAQKMLDNIFG